jgi:hypothetical protein
MNYNKIKSINLDSNAKIIKLLSEYAEITSKISGFQISLQQLKSNQKKMEDLFSVLGKDAMTIEKVKNDRRNELLEKTLPVKTTLEIFAYEKKKTNLLNRLIKQSSDYLQNCPDNKLLKISKKIWTIANKYGGYSLAYISKEKSSSNSYKSDVSLLKNEFGLTPEMLKSIENANIAFIESLLLYEDEMKDKKRIIGKIKKINKRTEKLLEYKIDRYTRLFEIEKPEFIKEYQKIREYQRQGGFTETETSNQKTPAVEKPVEKKTVTQVKPQAKPKTTTQE